jgi:hypothetical protein
MFTVGQFLRRFGGALTKYRLRPIEKALVSRHDLEMAASYAFGSQLSSFYCNFSYMLLLRKVAEGRRPLERYQQVEREIQVMTAADHLPATLGE